jgi:hypothetical protein
MDPATAQPGNHARAAKIDGSGGSEPIPGGGALHPAFLWAGGPPLGPLDALLTAVGAPLSGGASKWPGAAGAGAAGAWPGTAGSWPGVAGAGAATA